MGCCLLSSVWVDINADDLGRYKHAISLSVGSLLLLLLLNNTFAVMVNGSSHRHIQQQSPYLIHKD